jgi:hypothetical protein
VGHQSWNTYRDRTIIVMSSTEPDPKAWLPCELEAVPHVGNGDTGASSSLLKKAEKRGVVFALCSSWRDLQMRVPIGLVDSNDSH